MKHFVVGLPFTAVADRVALIRKNRPDWQAGKLNGPGGKLEAGETAVEAMSREMAEESGVAIPPESWTLIAVKQDEDVRVDIFACFDDRVGAAVSLTDEAVSLHAPNDPIIDTDGLEHIRLLVDHALKRDGRILSLPTSRPEAVARRVAEA